MHSEHQQQIENNSQVQDSTTSGTHQTGASVGSNSNCKHRITISSLNKFQICTHYDLSIIITKTDYFHSIYETL